MTDQMKELGSIYTEYVYHILYSVYFIKEENYECQANLKEI